MLRWFTLGAIRSRYWPNKKGQRHDVGGFNDVDLVQLAISWRSPTVRFPVCVAQGEDGLSGVLIQGVAVQHPKFYCHPAAGSQI